MVLTFFQEVILRVEICYKALFYECSVMKILVTVRQWLVLVSIFSKNYWSRYEQCRDILQIIPARQQTTVLGRKIIGLPENNLQEKPLISWSSNGKARKSLQILIVQDKKSAANLWQTMWIELTMSNWKNSYKTGGSYPGLDLTH